MAAFFYGIKIDLIWLFQCVCCLQGYIVCDVLKYLQMIELKKLIFPCFSLCYKITIFNKTFQSRFKMRSFKIFVKFLQIIIYLYSRWFDVLNFCGFIYCIKISIADHPHSTYAQRGRGGVKPNAYDCVQGRGVKECVRTQKNFLDHKIAKFFFVQKKLLHIHLLFCIEKCKPALSYK